jgi:hypothetical protein
VDRKRFDPIFSSVSTRKSMSQVKIASSESDLVTGLCLLAVSLQGRIIQRRSRILSSSMQYNDLEDDQTCTKQSQDTEKDVIRTIRLLYVRSEEIPDSYQQKTYQQAEKYAKRWMTPTTLRTDILPTHVETIHFRPTVPTLRSRHPPVSSSCRRYKKILASP